MPTFLNPVETDEDLLLRQAICRAESMTEACRALVVAVERIAGLAALFVLAGAIGRPDHLVAVGAGAASIMPLPGPAGERMFPDPADWLRLPIEGMVGLYLLLRSQSQADDEGLPAGVVQAQLICHRSAPLLEALCRRLQAEFRHRATDVVLALCEQGHAQPLKPHDLVNAIVSLGLAGVWLWGKGESPADRALLAAGGTDGQGALAPIPPAWSDALQGPAMDPDTGLTWLPIHEGGRMLAWAAIRFPPDWCEIQCLTALECLPLLTGLSWLPAVITAAMQRLRGTAMPAPPTGTGDRAVGGDAAALKSIAQQAAQMTHDVRNKLNVVATGAYLLRLKVEPGTDASVARLLQQIEDNVQASSELMSELLAIYRRTS